MASRLSPRAARLTACLASAAAAAALLAVVVGSGPRGLRAGEFEPEIALRKELGLPSVRKAVLGHTWSHTPEFYRAQIAALLPTLKAGPQPGSDASATIETLSVAYLELGQFDQALAAIQRLPDDPYDYGRNADLSIIYARRAATETNTDALADLDLAEKFGTRAAQISADPLHRDALYLRILTWLKQVRVHPELRATSSLLGYSVESRARAAITRDHDRHIEHLLPMPTGELMNLLGEDPGTVDELVAILTVDRIAVSDILMTLAELNLAQGDLETAYFAYCRLSELGGPYDGGVLEARRQALLLRAHAQVLLGPDRRTAVPLDDEARGLLDDQLYQAYLEARRAAQAYADGYVACEKSLLTKPPIPNQRRILEIFQRQTGAPPTTPSLGAASPPEPPAGDEPSPDHFDSAQLLKNIAVWVPLSLLLAAVLLVGVRIFRKWEGPTVRT